jgi:hypothetical protein
MAVTETKEAKRERQLAELASSDLATIEGRPPGAPAPEDTEETGNVEEAPAPVRTGPDTPPAQRGDPGVDMADVLEKRIRAAIEDNTDEVLTELTDLRDRADQLMHAIRESSRASIDGAVTHARRVSKAIQAKKFIARALEQIEAEFNGKGNAVITQQKKQ